MDHDSQEKVYSGRSQWADVLIRFKRNPFAILGLVIIACIILIALYGVFFIDYDTQVVATNVRNKLQSPSADHWFGTDNYGRDIFSRIIYGSRYSLTIGFSVTLCALLVGSVIGIIAGYFGGRIDNVLMRIMDMFIAIPSTLLAIAIVSALGPGMVNLIISMIIADMPAYSRIIRSSVMTIKDLEYIEASKALGASHLKIITSHVVPNSIAPLIVQATLGVGFAMITAAGLSYLGLGIESPKPEWGGMLSEGQNFIRNNPNLVIFPGFFIMVTVLGLNLLGDGLRDALDPKLKD